LKSSELRGNYKSKEFLRKQLSQQKHHQEKESMHKRVSHSSLMSNVGVNKLSLTVFWVKNSVIKKKQSIV